MDPHPRFGQAGEENRAGGHGRGGILEAGDGFIAELVGHCVGAWHWDPTTALDAPIGIVILGLRAERREADGCKGFGWVQLDGFQESTKNPRKAITTIPNNVAEQNAETTPSSVSPSRN